MSEPRSEQGSRDEVLRRAFQAWGTAAAGECSAEDRDLVWQAVQGALPASERRALVGRMATEPQLAAAWRVAAEVWSAAQGEQSSEPETTRVTAAAARFEPARPWWSWSPAWIGAVAAVGLVATAAVTFVFNRPPAADELRGATDFAVESVLSPEATLSREAFRLGWTAGPPGSRYQVRVTTEDLRAISMATDLTAPSFVVPAERLASLATGARVLWQVDVVTPDGERISSPTFVAFVQ